MQRDRSVTGGRSARGLRGIAVIGHAYQWWRHRVRRPSSTYAADAIRLG